MNLCAIVKSRVAKRPRAHSVVEMEQQLQEEWDALDQNLIQKLFNSMPNRIAAVIAAKGGSTKY